MIILSLIRKEFIHIRNDIQTVMIIFLFPVFMLLLYGYAITMEMRNIPTAVCDLSHTAQSRALVERFSASGFFKLTAYPLLSEQELLGVFQQRAARCFIVIPENFARATIAHEADIQLLIDASDPNAAQYIENYVQAIVQKQFPVQVARIQIEPRTLYNPGQRSSLNFIPGLTALIVIMICALLTSITIAREKEMGTMEQMLVSPVSAWQIIIGKVVPYVCIGFAMAIIVLGAGLVLFHVPCYGSPLLLAGALLDYIFLGLGMGILISANVATQQAAMMFSLMATMLPSMMLSGFVFPIASMPLVFQYLSNLVPAKYFIVILRGILLKGDGFAELWVPLAIMLFMTIVIVMVSIKRFHTSLE